MTQATDREGRTPLHYVPLEVPRERHGEETRRLIAEGCDPNARDKKGWGALHFAAEGCALECAAELLASGAEVDSKDDHGNTPLGKAVFAFRGDGRMIELLRRHGANPRLENNHGVSPLSLARTIANYDVRQYFADLPNDAPNEGAV